MPEAPLEDVGSASRPRATAGSSSTCATPRGRRRRTASRSRPARSAASRAASSSFPQVGVKIRVLEPGEPNGLYHSENRAGGVPRALGGVPAARRGRGAAPADVGLLPQPRGTEHIFVGAGDGPCAILMAGARLGGRSCTTRCRSSRRATARASRRRRPTSRRCTRGSSRRAESGPATGTASPGLADAGTLLHGDGEFARRAMARALIFDLDGTLVDTVYAHVFAWQRALLEAGSGRRLADPSPDRDERRPVRPRGRARDRPEPDRTRPRRSSAATARSSGRSCPTGGRSPAPSSCSATLREGGIVHGIATSGRRPEIDSRSRRSASPAEHGRGRARRRAAREARARPLPRLPGAARRRDQATATSSATRSGTCWRRAEPGCSASAC